jgi:hypothetical protein
MIKISQNQVLDRWDTLPMELREALCSESNSDFLWKICEAEHIPDEKIYDASRISGYVLMGFLHPEDVAEELHEAIGIDVKTASLIEDELNRRIFAPLRQQIDQVYAPLSKYEIDSQIIKDAKAPRASIIPVPRSAPAPITPPTPPAPSVPPPQIISDSLSATGKFGSAPLASNRDIAAPAPQAPKPSDAGWSKATPQEPVVKLGAITPGVPKPAPSTPMATTNSMPAPQGQNATPKTISMPAAKPSVSQPPMRTMSEFERLDLMKKSSGGGVASPAAAAAPAPAPAAAVVASAQPPKPAPVMLHEVSTFAPIQSSSAAFNTKQPAQDQLSGRTAQGPMAAKPAVVEFGNTGTPGVARPSTVPTPAMPIPPPPPTENKGPRQLTEIQAPATQGPMLMPPMPPMPASSMQPPSQTPPTQQQKGKVIVKDFL